MMSRSSVFSILLLGLIGIMALCGALAFCSSSAYSWIYGVIAGHWPGLSLWIPELIWFFLFLLGIFLVIGGKSANSFTWTTAILSLPSILSFSSVSILRIVNLNVSISTRLNDIQAFILGIAILTCYLTIRCLLMFKQTRDSLKKRGASAEDIKTTSEQSHLWMLAMVGSTVVAVILVFMIAQGLSILILHTAARTNWNYILAGIVSVLLLAGFLYWLGLRRSSD